MQFFCSCRICKIKSINGIGRWLSKKTFKKHQKKEKAIIEKINESEAESGSETKSDSKSISSCNIAEKERLKILNQIQVQKVVFRIMNIFLQF